MELKITIEMNEDACQKFAMTLQSLLMYPWDTDKPVLGTTEAAAEPITIEEKAKPKDASKTVDYNALRKEIKALAIKTVQAKKKTELKALTAAYGKERIDDLEDDQLELYLLELKEL